MSIFHLCRKAVPAPESLPPFVREVRDTNGVRVVRLQGAVGKEIGADAKHFIDEAERDPEPFERSLLLDFAGTSGADFSTVAYLVEAIKKRLGKQSKLGIINPPKELVSEIEIARLQDLITIYPSEPAALAALSR